METKYERVRVLGKGSFGSALLVKHRASGILYVAKEISIQAMSAQEREEARQEFRVLQQVDHPNVIRYIEHIENRGKLYIITEYANGGDMYTLLRRQSGKLLSEGEILRYFCQICLALQYLHEHYILHRDVKTMNIFLTKSGIVKLGDFGVATVLRNTMALARTVCGTPYYFSPELCRNAPYNNKSDVWALGCVLYEMCTLRNAFDGVNMKALVAKILRGAYPPIAPSYSEELKFLIASLLKRAPTERPGINRILAHRIVSNALGKFQEELTASTAPSLNKKVGNKNLTPGRFGQRGERGRRSRDDSGPVNLPAPNVPHPLIRPIFPLPDRRQDPSLLKGNIFRSPQERVKVWMENRLKQKQERAKQLKVQQPNRGNFKKDPPYLNKKPEPSTRNTSDLKAVKVNRKPSMVQQRHVKAAPQLGGPIRRLDGAAVEASLQQHVEDKQSVLELDHLLRKAVVDNRKQVERGHRELRGWKPSHLKHRHEVVNSGTPEIAMRAWEGTPIHLPSSPVRESKQLHIGTRSNSDASNVRLSFSPGTGSLCEFDPAIACPSQPLNKEQTPIPEVSNSLADSTPKEKNWNFPYPFHHPRYGRRSLSGLSHLKEHSFDKRNIAMESRADRPLQVASSLDFDSATESAEAGKEDDISTELHKFQDNSVVVQIQNIQAHIRAIVTRTSDEINDIDFGDEATIDAGGPAGTDNDESDSEAQVEDEPSIDASERDEREIGTLQKAGILRCEEDQSSRNKKVDKVGVKRVKAPTQSGVWQDSDNSNASSVGPIQSLVKCTSERIAVFGPHASANVTLTTTQRKQRRDLDNWLSTLFPQSPVTGVSPTVESTPSARITTKSSLYTRTEVVRQHLETLLGLETFLQAYRTLELVTRRPSTPSGAATASALVEESLQTDASASEDEEGYAEVERILGPDHVYLLPLIVQLIFCEEEENIIQKSHDPTQNT